MPGMPWIWSEGLQRKGVALNRIADGKGARRVARSERSANVKLTLIGRQVAARGFERRDGGEGPYVPRGRVDSLSGAAVWVIEAGMLLRSLTT